MLLKLNKNFTFKYEKKKIFTCSCLNSSAKRDASEDAFLRRSSEFFNSTIASSKSACIATLSPSNLRFCAPRVALCVLNSLILSAASCKSFSAALRALSAWSNAALISSSSLAIKLALLSALAAASRASSRCLCSSSILACNSLKFKKTYKINPLFIFKTNYINWLLNTFDLFLKVCI